MRHIPFKVIALMVTLLTSTGSIAQDSGQSVSREFHEELVRNNNKLLPDMVLEVGTVFLMVLVVTNAVITLFKINAERRIKEKALDKGISEDTLIELFRQDKSMIKNNYLKWFLILASLGISLIYIYLLDVYTSLSSGTFSLGIIALFMSIAFLIYYRITRNQK